LKTICEGSLVEKGKVFITGAGGGVSREKEKKDELYDRLLSGRGESIDQDRSTRLSLIVMIGKKRKSPSPRRLGALKRKKTPSQKKGKKEEGINARRRSSGKEKQKPKQRHSNSPSLSDKRASLSIGRKKQPHRPERGRKRPAHAGGNVVPRMAPLPLKRNMSNRKKGVGPSGRRTSLNHQRKGDRSTESKKKKKKCAMALRKKEKRGTMADSPDGDRLGGEETFRSPPKDNRKHPSGVKRKA